MSLTEVVVSSEVWLTCATHALSTEAEEIMGLLLGDIHYDHSGRTPVVSAKIWGAAPQVRADRRKDRVETTPEQLAAASAEAERMSVATGMRTRVIGWYHSHPHITVHPSHVDVRTQGMYQMLDEGFVGLIFSAFNRASSHAQAGQLQAVAFQSVSARDKEQREQRSQHTPARGQWAQLGTKREHSSHPSVSDLEPQELAVVLAAVDDDVPSSDFTAWEVPIKVVSSARAFPSLPRAHAVAPLTGLQRMLLVEEKEAYEKAVEHAGRHGEPNPLELIHHHATYQAALCRLMETCLVPAIAALENITRSNKAALLLKQEEQARASERASHAQEQFIVHPSAAAVAHAPTPAHPNKSAAHNRAVAHTPAAAQNPSVAQNPAVAQLAGGVLSPVHVEMQKLQQAEQQRQLEKQQQQAEKQRQLEKQQRQQQRRQAEKRQQQPQQLQLQTGQEGREGERAEAGKGAVDYMAQLSALHVSSPHSPIASSPPPMSSSQPAPVTPGVTPGVRSSTEAAAQPVVSRTAGPSTRDTRTQAGGYAKRHSGNSSHSRETGQAMGQVQASRREAPARGDRAGQRSPALSAGMGTGTDGGMVTGTATGVSTGSRNASLQHVAFGSEFAAGASTAVAAAPGAMRAVSGAAAASAGAQVVPAEHGMAVPSQQLLPAYPPSPRYAYLPMNQQSLDLYQQLPGNHPQHPRSDHHNRHPGGQQR